MELRLVTFFKRCPHVQQTMPSFQYDRHALHCFWGPSQATQTVPRCPRLESSVFTLDWTYYLLKSMSVWSGSQFSESILERLCSAHATQQNVLTLEFWSPGSPRSALFAHDLNRHGLQRVAPVYHEEFGLQRWILSFHDKSVFGNHMAHFLCLFQQRVAPIFHVPIQRWRFYCRQIFVHRINRQRECCLYFAQNFDLQVLIPHWF